MAILLDLTGDEWMEVGSTVNASMDWGRPLNGDGA